MSPSDLATLDEAALSTDLRELSEQAEKFATAGKSMNTKRAYRSDWKVFSAWCERMGVRSMPASPRTVFSFVTDMARIGRKVATINRYCTTITKAHRMTGHASPVDNPEVQEVLAGIRRTIGTKPSQKKAAVLSILRSMCESCPQGTIHGIRDRAVLLVAWAGAFRRSEVVSLLVEDVEFVDGGLMVTVRKSKTDQEGAGARIGIPFGSDPATCPVRCLKAWLCASGITNGTLFRPILRGKATAYGRAPARDGGKLIARIVKRAAKRAGLDPRLFGGHSLRAGLATQAAMAGKPDRVIMRQGRWVDRRTLERYIREGTVFRENAAAGIGL
jgi:integrase